MRQLFELIYRFRAFFTFVLFEVISFWLIIGNNEFHNAAFFNTSNNMIASVFAVKQSVYKYFNLSNTNQDLALENAFLRELIDREARKKEGLANQQQVNDALYFHPLDTVQQFDYIAAKVLNNSFRMSNNFITVNKGRVHGIEPEMGVISSGGMVGQVKAVSSQFSTIYSLLHSEMYVSSMIKRLGVFGSTQWQGGDPLTANLLFIPRHVRVQPGDTIITSGYNAIFPAGIPIGTVSTIDIEENETFYNISINLSVDFTRLSFVYIIKNRLKAEKDSVENIDE